LVRLARQVGLVRGEWVAIDGSKFRAVASTATVRERESVKRYLDQLESADEQDEVVLDPSAVAAALEKLKHDPEPEARFMRMAPGHAPAYNVQTAVDAEHGIIIAHEVTTEASDNRSLLPMAEAAKRALDNPETLNVVADAGYSNGEQAERCEEQGIVPHVPANRSTNNQGNGTLFDRSLFIYDEKTDTFRCPANQTLHRKQLSKKDRCVMYAAVITVCDKCPLKQRCTKTSRRWITRHLHDGALQRMNARATAQAMRLRRCTVERPFALLKYVIFGHPRLLLRGLAGAQTEISFATLAYNLKTVINVFGASKLAAALS
jgi:transposase